MQAKLGSPKSRQHISKVTSICYYHLGRLCQIRNYVSREIMIQLVMSLVICRMDYCNSVLVGLPASILAPLQRVQNAAARLILGLSRRSHITPALKQLHWLPIKFCITFKVATLMYNIFHQRTPYLKDLVAFSPSASASATVIHNQVRCRPSNKNTVRSTCILSQRP